jgi:type IV pilus assembly protein PilQ
MVVLGSACAPFGNLWQSRTTGSSSSQELADNSSSNEEVLGNGSQVEVATGKQILLSDQSAGFAVMQESELTSDKFSLQLSKSDPVMNVMKLTAPPRLVVDLVGVRGTQTKEIAVKGSDGVSAIRIGAHADKVRVVFDLKSKEALAGHSIDSIGQEIVLNVPVLENTRLSRVSSMADKFSANAQLGEQLGEAKEEAKVEEVKQEELPNTTEEAPEAKSEEVSEDKVSEDKENDLESAKETTVVPASNSPILTQIKFEKNMGSSGEITANLTDQVAYELKQTSPSEYVIAMPGVKAEEAAKKPMIAAKGEEGIRSVRVTENKEGLLVRMFVDAGVILSALPRGNDILIKAGKPSAASGARAQLESPDTKGLTDGDKTAQSNPTGFRSADGSKIYSGRLISLDLQDTNIDSALRIIAEISNLNIIASDDVNGKVTLRLIDVPWDQALDVILKTNGLDQVAEGNVIRIAPVDKLKAERESLKESKRAAENLEDLTIQYIRVSYARAEDVRPKVEAVLSERGTVTADERTNQLIIKDIKTGQKAALDLLKKLDLRTPQILLETQIVEGNRSMLRDLGFQWNFSHVQSPQTGNATGLNFPNSANVSGEIGGFSTVTPAAAAGSAITAILDSADGTRALGARLTALETEGKIKVVSRPQVATVNNKSAQISSIEVVRILLPSAGTTIGVGQGASTSGGGAQAFQTFNVGIELDVTPQASPDYYVLLDVNAKSSTFSGTEVQEIPNTFERETTSTILVKSGQTFALGGVYKTTDKSSVTGIPFLKDIPVLGHLFRSLSNDNADEELIFFITPHIVEGSFDASAM